MYTTILLYKQQLQSHFPNNHYQLYSLVDSVYSSDQSHSSETKESTINQFIQSYCHYVVTEETDGLKDCVHHVVEEIIIGSKDKLSLSTSFGQTISFIQQLLFDHSCHLFEEQNALLTLLKFYVSTGYFDEELVTNDEFIYNLFGLLSIPQLFVKTSLLLESLLERRHQSIDLSQIVSFKDTLRSLSYLQLGIFLPVINHFIHNQECQLYTKENCQLLVDCNVVDKLLKLLSLSSNQLTIIYLLQNEMILDVDTVIHQFQSRYVSEIESYPEVDIDFSGVQGLYCADVCANILFIISTILQSLTTTSEKEELLQYTSVCEMASNLYLCLDIETIQLNNTNGHATLYHSLFYQYIHLLSNLPSSLLFSTLDGLELMELILIDLEDNDVDYLVKMQFVGMIECIVRESTLPQKESLGTEKSLIFILLRLLKQYDQEEEYQERRKESLHLIYDLFGLLLRGSRVNTETFLSHLHCPLNLFLQKCQEDCITTSVFFRSLILNIMYDNIIVSHHDIQNIRDIIKDTSIMFFSNLLDAISHQGITSHTTCCINTIIVIIGIFSSLSLQSDLYIHLQSSQSLSSLHLIISVFRSKYSSQSNLQDLCAITQTSSSLWISALQWDL